MTKDFVPYKESLELKCLGFDDLCLTSNYSTQRILSDEEIKKGIIGFPLFSQAFRWFREKHLYHKEILYRNSDHKYLATIYPLFPETEMFVCGKHSTYEEAELACLRKLIEIVKK